MSKVTVLLLYVCLSHIPWFWVKGNLAYPGMHASTTCPVEPTKSVWLHKWAGSRFTLFPSLNMPRNTNLTFNNVYSSQKDFWESCSVLLLLVLSELYILYNLANRWLTCKQPIRLISWVHYGHCHLLINVLFRFTTDDQFNVLYKEGILNWTIQVKYEQMAG